MIARTISRKPLPSGDKGALVTLAEMKRLILEGTRDPGVISLAREIVADIDPRDHRARVEALFEFVRDRVRYVRDPRDIELIVGAPAMVEEIADQGETTGDCDEKAILLASLLRAVGYPVALVAARTRPVRTFLSVRWPWSHVYVRTQLPSGEIITLDPTRDDAEPGQEIPNKGTQIYPIDPFVKTRSFSMFGQTANATKTSGGLAFLANDPLIPILRGDVPLGLPGMGDLGAAPKWLQNIGGAIGKGAKAVVGWFRSGSAQKTGETLAKVGWAATPEGQKSIEAGYRQAQFWGNIGPYVPVILGAAAVALIIGIAMRRK